MSDTSPALHTRLAADIGPALAWIHDRAWPLGGIGLVVTVLCLLHYARQEQVPLDLASPSVIAAIPVLFALIGFVTAVSALTFLMPAWLLSWPLHAGDPPIGEPLKPLNTDPKVASAMLAARHRLGAFWMLTSAVQAAALLLVGAMPETWPPGLSTLAGGLLVVLAVLTGAFFVLLIPAAPGCRWSLGAWGNASAIAFAHLVCVLTLLLICLQRASGWPTAIGTMVAALVGLSMAQLGAWQFTQRLHDRPHPLADAAIAGAAALLCVAIAFPPVGAALASFALRAPLTGGAECVEITWIPDRAPPEVGRWLYITAPAGDILLAHKPYQSDTTYFVRRDAIQSMAGLGCREAESRMNAEHTRATQASRAPPLPASAEQTGDAH